MTELRSKRHRLLHLLLVLSHMVHVVSKSLFSSQSCCDVLQLLLHQLLWLRMVEVVQLQLQRFVILTSLDVVLKHQSFVLLLQHAHVLGPSEVVIFLKQDGVVFKLFVLKYCFKIFLVEVFVLELANDDVTLFCFSKPCQKHVKVVLHLL